MAVPDLSFKTCLTLAQGLMLFAFITKTKVNLLLAFPRLRIS